MSNAVGYGATPVVGLGATISGYTDRYAATIIEVSANGKKIVVQEDAAKRVDSNGMSESQIYEFSRNPNGRVRKFYLNKSNRWQESKGTARLTVGHRNAYHDFTF